VATTSDDVRASSVSTIDSAFVELVRRFHANYPTFRIGDDLIRRYHLASSTRGFVILCGPSGTGKTWLAQAYAETVGARIKLVAVDPSWSSNEDLLGYLSPLDGFYHHTPFSEFVADAAREWNSANGAGRTVREFHVILDEMNLARVEHYFSRFLSAMEIRTREGVARLDLAPGHTVELTPYADVVLRVWDIFHDVSPFGFRVLDEIDAYVTAAEEVGTDWHTALDEQLMQKVLPRVRGDASAGEAIDAFLELVSEDYPLSAAKTRAMRRDLDEHGFVAYF